MTKEQTKIGYGNGNLGKERGEMPETEYPSMFLRRGVKGGLYFFSPKNTVIYYLSGQHVRDLLEGRRDFAVIHKGEAKREGHEQ